MSFITSALCKDANENAITTSSSKPVFIIINIYSPLYDAYKNWITTTLLMHAIEYIIYVYIKY